MSDDPLMDKLDEQTGSTREERAKFYKEASETRSYKNLDSVLQNIVYNASKFTDFDLEKIDIQDLYGFMVREGLDAKAIATISSDVFTHTVGVMADDKKALGKALIELNLNESQVKAGLTLFMLGFRYKERNTSLVATLISQKKETDAPDAEGTEVPTP